jgi:hypothetical protein
VKLFRKFKSDYTADDKATVSRMVSHDVEGSVADGQPLDHGVHFTREDGTVRVPGHEHVSTMSSNKGNCTKIRSMQQRVDEYWPIKLPSRDDYPTPRHGENVGQLPFLDDFRHVAEINVLLTADGQV